VLTYSRGTEFSQKQYNQQQHNTQCRENQQTQRQFRLVLNTADSLQTNPVGQSSTFFFNHYFLAKISGSAAAKCSVLTSESTALSAVNLQLSRKQKKLPESGLVRAESQGCGFKDLFINSLEITHTKKSLFGQFSHLILV